MIRRALAFAAAAFLVWPVAAQVQRAFPQNALRGAIVFGSAPEIALNGRPARLAPGTRIRDTGNMTVVPAVVYGGRYLVHYTIDPFGLVKDVWILTAEEAANQPWPRSPDEAEAWSFDPVAQLWTKP
ncbi:MAG: hypothetical protein ABI699_15220 [Caldimonas sp.]